MLSASRNRVLARLAFIVGRAEGMLSPTAAPALLDFLAVNGHRINQEDQADILAYFDDLRFRTDAAAGLTPNERQWSDALPRQLLVSDVQLALDLVVAIAEADSQLVTDHNGIVANIRFRLSGATRLMAQAV